MANLLYLSCDLGWPETNVKTQKVSISDIIVFKLLHLLKYIEADGCINDTNYCDMNTNCTNTNGSFMCSCHIEWYEEGVNCDVKRF